MTDNIPTMSEALQAWRKFSRQESGVFHTVGKDGRFLDTFRVVVTPYEEILAGQSRPPVLLPDIGMLLPGLKP